MDSYSLRLKHGDVLSTQVVTFREADIPRLFAVDSYAYAILKRLFGTTRSSVTFSSTRRENEIELIVHGLEEYCHLWSVTSRDLDLLLAILDKQDVSESVDPVEQCKLVIMGTALGINKVIN